MNLPADIKSKINLDYPNLLDRNLVTSILTDLDVPENIRIIRCILFASNGNLKQFGELEALAKLDYRDVIMAAEYKPNSDIQVRDFNKPF